VACGGYHLMFIHHPPRFILVVEDIALLRMIAVDVLNDAGFATFEARDAADALEQIYDHPEIDLLFTDINMPGDIDGLELARRVHVARPEMGLILTSGRERPTGAQIPDHGRFLPKPYSADVMINLIREA